MQAVLYLRVSADAAGGRSVREQESDCRKVCAREGWPIAEVLVDNDRGASRHSKVSRPEYDRLTQVLKPGMVLVTWEASRGQRDLAAYVTLRDLCAERGVLWSYGGTTYDLSEGTARFRTGFDALMAEYAAEETRDRVLRALRANAADGKAHGRIPYGYRAVRDERTGKVVDRVVNEDEKAVIRDVVERVLAGQSIRSIRNRLNDSGVPTTSGKALWNTTQIHRMILRPVYAGMRVHNGTVTQGNWEPIISEDEQRRLRGVFADTNKPPPSRGSEVKYLLSGIARCGVCDALCYKAKAHGKPVYRCTSPTMHVSRQIEDVEGVVIDKILAIIESYRVELFFTFGNEPRTATPDSSEHLARAHELRQTLDAVYHEVTQGTVSAGALAKIEPPLLAQIAAAEALAEESLALADPRLKILDTPAIEQWATWDLEGRRRFIRATVDVVILPVVKKGRIPFDPTTVQVTRRRH